jgi:purine-cytosine permease-like protein
MEPNLAVSIYVRSSIKFLHFVPFHQQIWPPRAILVSDWLLFKKIFSSETAWQKWSQTWQEASTVCKILYKAFSFGSIRPTNMATKINSFF